MKLLLLARHDNWTCVVIAFLVMLSMRTITKIKSLASGYLKIFLVREYSPVRPILSFPAPTERSLFGDIFNIDHVNDLCFIQPNLLVDTFALTSTSWTLSNRTEGKISNVDEAGCESRWWNQRDPIFD